MEDNKIIIMLLCIIIAILVVGVIVFSQAANEDTSLSIADKKITVGDSLVVKLTDGDGNAIANQTVKVKITDKDGAVIDEDITTNSKGNAKFKMEQKGEYSVECSFDGNGQYASSSTAGDIKVKKAATEKVSQEQTSTTTHASKYAPNGGIYPEYGPEVDAQGITREEAIAKDMHYIEMTVDGDRPGEYVTVGGYVAYDAKAGCYHT
jgi:hypothetical protein